ncbi:MAG: class I SAM-dependent methyltransferase [Candidatus Binatia bacterium]
MFEVAEKYEEMMGRWSRQLAPLFVEFAGVNDGDVVLDVGCGTGALSSTLVRTTHAAKIVGIDPSEGFVEAARSQIRDPRVSIETGDAQALPYPDASFDRTLALLIVNFIPDAVKAAREMRRVTKPGGTVVTAMWDNSPANELNQCLWIAARQLDPNLKRPSNMRGSYGSAEALSKLFADAGLSAVEVSALTMLCHFISFEDNWRRYLTGEGPNGAYFLGLSDDRKAALEEKLRKNLFGDRPDGPFTLQAKAWAVRGVVP